MFDISTVVKRYNFEYWFVRASEFTWKILLNNDEKVLLQFADRLSIVNTKITLYKYKWINNSPIILI